MDENRSLFSLDGITGMLIATLLLLGILFFLTVSAMSVQKESATNFYELKDETSIKMIGSKQADHIVDVKK